MLLNELYPRHKDFVYVNFMRSGKVQQTRTEEVRGIDTRVISGSRCPDYKWKTF